MHPVILVHGIWDSSRKMRHIAKDLAEKGKTIFMIDLCPCDGSISIEEMAVQLRNFVDRKGLSEFDIVGYSMGGIVAKYYIAELGGDMKVKKFITISSPHHGTWWAYLYPFIVGKELRPRSALLKKLEEKMTTVTSVESLSLRTPLDLVIIPATSSKISWGKNVAFINPLHLLMVRDGRVRRTVINFLSKT